MILQAARVCLCVPLHEEESALHKRWLPHNHSSFSEVSHSSHTSQPHKRLREDSIGNERDGRCRSSRFFLLLMARGKQRRQRKLETLWSDKKRGRGRGEKEQRNLRCVIWSSLLWWPWSFASCLWTALLSNLTALNTKSVRRNGAGTWCKWETQVP